MRACVRACMRACVRACVCVCTSGLQFSHVSGGDCLFPLALRGYSYSASVLYNGVMEKCNSTKSQCYAFGRNVKTLPFIIVKPMYIIYNTIIDITTLHIKCIMNIKCVDFLYIIESITEFMFCLHIFFSMFYLRAIV